MTPAAAPASVYLPRLQRRLMRAFAGFALVAVALLGALAILFVYAVEDEFFDAALQAEVDRQRQHHAEHGRYTAPALPMVRLHPQGRDLPADLAAQVARHPARREFAGDGGRHYHLRRLDADGTLLVAEVSGQLVVRRMRQELLGWVLAAAGGLALLAMAVGAWLSRRIGAPVAALAERVAGMAPDELPRSLSQGLVHDEVGELARHLDRLHARTRAFIEREQAFATEVSHELRTPLAVLGVAAERLQAQAPAGLQPLVRSMQGAVWQLGRAVESMLALARETPAEPGGAREQPLLPVLERLVLAHAPLLDQEGVAVTLAVPATVTRPWPPAITHLLVGNLLGNAIAHAAAPEVVIEADADELRVINPGGPARGAAGVAGSGLGLGLSIARRLAERHGLVVELRNQAGRTIAVVRGRLGAVAAEPTPPA